MTAVNAISSLQFDEDEGKVILITDTTVEQAGFVIGRDYYFVARGGLALCRWGTDAASSADDGFDFAVSASSVTLVVRATQVALNVIEAESSSTATAVLAVGRIAID